MAGKYIIVDGIDGSGSSCLFKQIKSTCDFTGISKKSIDRGEISENFNHEWWNSSYDIFMSRFRYFLEMNVKLADYAESIVRENRNVVQLKGLLTTFLTHSYFMKEVIDIFHKNEYLKANCSPTLILAVYADIKTREKRFIEREKKDTLTSFDLRTLDIDYEKYWISNIKLFDTICPVVLVDTSNDIFLRDDQLNSILFP